MQLTQSLHKALRERPHQPAVIFGDRSSTFSHFRSRVARLAGVLRGLGMGLDDRVAMLGMNSDRYVEYFFGVWWGGGAINPVNVRWSPQEIAYSLDDCDTRILLVDKTFAGLVPTLRQLSKSLQTVVYVGDEAAPEGLLGYEELMATAEPVEDLRRHGDDLAAVMYTGGTTGRPKGVMLSHANLYLNGLASVAAVGRTWQIRALVTAPFFHVAGCGLSLQMILRMATQIVVPYYEEVIVMDAIAREQATETFLVPTMVKRLIEHPRFKDFDLQSLRMVLYGAAPIDATLLGQAMQALPGVQFCQAYGMTELAPTIAILQPDDHLPGPNQAKRLRSAGRSVPIAEISIRDADNNEVPVGQVGEICARGPMVMKGYWNKPAETEAALLGGWMHTGDGGMMDEDGYLYVVDRIKDMIVTGGENVYSAEVENALAQLEGVSMSAVIGVPDDKWGERVHAVIVKRPGAELDEAAVIAHCKSLIAGFKCPRSVEFRTELPVSPAGKLQKFVLREPYWKDRERKVN